MASKPLRPWFKLPGREGDRSLEEQLRGLKTALERARGKTVLDLGCAEGAIALEFARAGASQVLGLEVHDEFVEVARQLSDGQPCEFRCVDLNQVDEFDQADIVLALAVAHKLRDPAGFFRLAGRAARELVVVRMPGFAASPTTFRHIRGERSGELIDVARELQSEGFVLEAVERGPRVDAGLELVLYFRRLRTGGA